MKISKKEYENLLLRVANLELAQDEAAKDFALIIKELQERIDNYFKYKCNAIIIKRDRDMIVGEIRDNIMKNLFKEEQN